MGVNGGGDTKSRRILVIESGERNIENGLMLGTEHGKRKIESK